MPPDTNLLYRDCKANCEAATATQSRSSQATLLLDEICEGWELGMPAKLSSRQARVASFPTDASRARGARERGRLFEMRVQRKPERLLTNLQATHRAVLRNEVGLTRGGLPQRLDDRLSGVVCDEHAR